ncbi:MAG: hypothetical protein JO270_04825 [Acidobacteriaceae bacterium]|nr:hypothetical protein [Acidobacteriaceae bacterium]
MTRPCHVSPGANLFAPILDVRYVDLARLPNQEDGWKRACPVCRQGALNIFRHSETLDLYEFDHCTLCGQRVRYLDILDMRRVDSVGSDPGFPPLEGPIRVGERFVWEPYKDHARMRLRVTCLDFGLGLIQMEDESGKTLWAEEDRFREACVRDKNAAVPDKEAPREGPDYVVQR